MKDRVFELHRVLKDKGSFYLHCDWHIDIVIFRGGKNYG